MLMILMKERSIALVRTYSHAPMGRTNTYTGTYLQIDELIHIDLSKNAYTQKQNTHTYPQTHYAHRHTHTQTHIIYKFALGYSSRCLLTIITKLQFQQKINKTFKTEILLSLIYFYLFITNTYGCMSQYALLYFFLFLFTFCYFLTHTTCIKAPHNTLFSY